MSIHTLALPLALIPVLALAATPAPSQAGEDPGGILWIEVPQGRPWLGVGLAGTGDLEITEVHADSPAAAAGLRVGDRILSLDQDELADFDQLTGALARRQAGDQVRLGVGRSVTVTLSEEHRAEDGRPLLGVYLDGNRVTGVQEGHPAAAAGLEKGDRILAIDGERTRSYDGVVEGLRSSAGDGVDLFVGRHLTVVLGNRPQGLEAPAPVPAPAPRGFSWRPPQGGTGLAEAGGLRQELRSLAEEIAQLRAEIAALRAQIDALHAAQGR